MLVSLFALAAAAAAQDHWDIKGPASAGTILQPPFEASASKPVPAPGVPRELAQAAPAPSGPPAQIVPESEPQVDETALRYFARQRDTRRLEIEIARLRALYPNWTPPADPLAVPANVDERLEAIWLLYSQGKYAEARRAIAERQQSESGWEPPADLLERLGVAEARERLVNASNLKQYETVVRVGSETPSLLTCSEVDVLWRVAEAFARTDRAVRARDAYHYVLANCDNPQERLATMQKAAEILPPPLVDELLALERFEAGGAGEFAPVRDELARRAVAAGGEDAAVTISPEHISRVEQLASDQRQASDSLLLGWYHLQRDDSAAAERWFRQAQQIQPSAEAARGLALALIERGQHAEAEAAMFPWRREGEDAEEVYLSAVANLLGAEPRIRLTPEILARIVAEVADQRDAQSGQALGWYARDFNQFETAGQWFTAALSWDPDNEPAAYGLALTHHQLGDRRGLAELKRRWQGKSNRIERVGEPQSDTQARASARSSAKVADARRDSTDRTDAAPARTAAGVANSSAPTRRCTDTVHPENLGPDAALARGWCLMELDRPHEAARAFDVALRSRSERVRIDAAYGQSLAYLRAGLVDDAAVAATRAPQNVSRSSELQASILSDRALAAFENGRYVETLLALDKRAQFAAERVDLLILRGYAYYHLDRLAEAQRVFEAAAGTGSSDGLQGLALVRDAQRPEQKR